MRPFSLLSFALVLLLLGPASPSRAEFLTALEVQVTPQAGNLLLYEYTLTVDAASDRPAAALAIDVSAGAGLTDLLGPIGWEITYAAGDTFIAWDSLDASTDLAPGASAVFSFVSSLGPGASSYLVIGLGSDPVIAFNSGEILTPVAAVIPEPSSLILLGTGALGLAGFARSRRSPRVPVSHPTRPSGHAEEAPPG